MNSLFGDEDLTQIMDLLRNRDFSGWFNSREGGVYLKEFQRKFAEFCGSKYAFAVSSGSASLYVALRACGVGQGDWVAVPAYTHIGSVAPVVLAGARPLFVDVNEHGNIDPDDLGRTMRSSKKKVRAVIVVHQLGLPCDMNELPGGIFIIEDASHALGALYKGKKAGTLGDIGCFSVGGGRTKTIGTGEGGMLTVKDDELAERCNNIRNHGDRVSDCAYFCFNFRMSELNALVGLVQMKKLEFLINWQIERAQYLTDRLPDYLRVSPLPSYARSVRYLVGCRFNQERAGISRDDFLKIMEERNFQQGPRKYVGEGYSKLISDTRFYSQYRRKLAMSEKLIKESVWLDYHRYPRTTEEIDGLLSAFEEIRQQAK